MDYIFAAGLLGSLTLVTGSAWPEGKQGSAPVKSIKNWLFAIGALIMLTYSTLGYLNGGAIFYIFLQALVIIASVMMMLDTNDKTDITVISLAGIIIIGWSLYLFEDYSTILFIFGLIGIALGYTLQANTARRQLALVLGSLLIALFSYLVKDWIFFWLNTFFAIFSGYYLIKALRK